MSRLILSIYDKLSKRKWLICIQLIVFMGICLALALSIRYEEDIAEFLPQNEESRKYSDVYNNLGGQDKIVLIFASEETEREEEIIRAMETMNGHWETMDTVGLMPGLEIRVDGFQVIEVMEFVCENYPYFLTDEDYLRMDSLLSIPGYISQSMERNKEMLMLPTGGMMTQTLRYDPLHLFSPVLARLQSFNPHTDYHLIDGCIFNPEGTQALAFLTSPYGISESKQNEELLSLLDKLIIQTSEEHPQVKISAIGAPMIAVGNAKQIKKDSLLAVSLALLLIFAVLIIAFRRFDDLFWIAASILFGSLFALGLMALIKDSVSMIVLGIGSVIIGIAVNYPLHYLDHIKHERNKRTALKEMVSPLLIGNITTVSAFLCLLFLEAEAMRDLGLFGSLTLIGTIIFVLLFLPSLVSARKTVGRYPDFNPERLNPIPGAWRRKLFLPFALITAVLFYFSLNTSFDSDLRNINYMTDKQRTDMEALTAGMQQKDGNALIYLVAEGKNTEEALKNQEALLENQRVLFGNDVTIKGIQNFMPSVARQKRGLAQWAKFWEEHQATIKTFKQACLRLGFSIDAFNAFLDPVENTPEPQESGYFELIRTSLGQNYMLESDDKVQIVNYLYVPQARAASLKNELKNELSNAFAFDSQDVSNQLVTMLSDSFNYLGFVCGFVVFFFLWLSFGRLEISLLAFIPLAVSWIWILGTMHLFNIQFNIVNIILATFIFGQGDDYTIFITEGLMYEYAYGKKVLKSYKNSVALSAIIMFVGIGVLIFAKHPAMRSLAEVAIIGMLTVVVMTYYLPSLLFNWLTRKKKQVREVPLTIKRIGYSLFSILFFLTGCYFVMIPYAIYIRLVGATERRKLKYHRALQGISRFIIYRVPGTSFTYENKANEDFNKPALIVCNHQSHLDLMALMMLTPKLVILTNEWVWNNPFYGIIIRMAEFYPVSNGVDANVEQFRSLMDRGYSVAIFPEGTRSEDCSIQRFHQGAFHFARQLNVDILPVFIHGMGHVLPKKDFMLREASMYMEIGERIPAAELQDMPALKIASRVTRLYRKRYAEISRRCEHATYFAPYVKYKYMYKGRGIERRCQATLKCIREFAHVIDRDYAGITSVCILNSGQGEFAWLFALVHPEIKVYACEPDEELHGIAAHTAAIPGNLCFVGGGRGAEATSLTIDYQSLKR